MGLGREVRTETKDSKLLSRYVNMTIENGR